MIPILFEKNATEFTTNGLGQLSECISCVVTEEKNGIYELEFIYPLTGRHYNQMVDNGGTVCVWHDDRHDIQAFDIYAHTDPMNGQVTFNAHHISYRLNRIIVTPFTAQSPATALASLKLNAANACPFEFWTDKTGSSEMSVLVPSDIRSLLFGQEGSILDVYGKGEYEFDMFNVKLYVDRGQDTQVTIRYGKNLSDIQKEYDENDVFNAVAPYWIGSEGEIVYPPEVIVTSPNIPPVTKKMTVDSGNDISIFYNHRTIPGRIITGNVLEANVKESKIIPVPLDLSSYFEEEPTIAQLRSEAISYIDRNETWAPDENIKVDFVALWQTPEYENLAILQRCSLCDKVSVYYPELGVIAEKKEIIKVEYDVLLERYKSIELGKRSATLTENITQEVIDTGLLEDVPTISMMQMAINRATDLITGGLGGYVVIKTNANHEPEEILIMDTPSVNTAVNVIRMNRNGIGFSNNGYNGPFTSAWTIDGNFNADFITAGSINASLITTGALIADIIKTGRVESDNGSVYFDLDNNELCCSKMVQNLPGSQYTTNRRIVAKIEGLNGQAGYNTGGFFKLYQELLADGSIYGDPTVFHFDGQSMQVMGPLQGLCLGVADDWINYNSSINFYGGNNKRFELNLMNYGSSGSGYFEMRPSYTTLSSGRFTVSGDFQVQGNKNRSVETKNYGNRLLSCYEMASPMFGDIGEGKTDDHGECIIAIDDIFSETANLKNQYQVFLQKNGNGDIWVSERNSKYFVVTGTPNLKFSWEIKAKQANYEFNRLEDSNEDFFYNDYDADKDNRLAKENELILEEMEAALYETAI